MGASTYQYDSECRKCGKLEYFCKCEPYPKLTAKELADIEVELSTPKEANEEEDDAIPKEMAVTVNGKQYTYKLEEQQIMTDKTFKIVNGGISDGYHTFDELYEHRCLLFLAFCIALPERPFFVKDHYKGWDLVRIGLMKGKQISYHVPSKYRSVLIKHDFICISKDYAEEDFDGHASADVIKRLEERIGYERLD